MNEKRSVYCVRLPNGNWYKNHAKGSYRYKGGVSIEDAQVFHQKSGASRAAKRFGGTYYEFELDPENFKSITDPNK